MKFITYKQYWEYVKNRNLKALSDQEERYQIAKEKDIYNEKKVKQIDKKHDKVFRNVLSRKKEMANFLNQFLDLQEYIKEENIIACPTDFITKSYEMRQSDIIYRLKDKPIYFLVEHQSTVDKEMLLRIWEYVGEIVKKEKFVPKNNFIKDSIYPVVIPIVIYTGNQRWNAKTNFAQKQYQSIEYHQYEINVEYNLIDLHDYTFEELLDKKSLLGSILIMEKCKKQEELEMYANKIIDTIVDDERQNIQSEIIYMTMLPYVKKEKLDEILEKIKEKEEISMSPLTKMMLDLEIESERRGEKRGEKRGVEKGKIEKIREIVKNMQQLGETEDKILMYIGISKEELDEIREVLVN